MVNGNPGRPAASPFAAAPPPAASPFVASGHVASRPGGVSVRPPPISGPTPTMPFSSNGPLAGSPTPPPFRPGPPGGFVHPSTLAPPVPSPSQVPPTLNQFQRFSSPQYPAPPQASLARPPPVGPPNMAQSPVQPIMGPPIQQPGVTGPSPPVNFRPPSQIPPVQMTPPPQTYAQAPPAQPPSYYSPQPGYIQPNAHQGMPAMHGMQQPFASPPSSSMQDLIEDFSSLALGAVPGLMDSGLDPKALPRPLEGDVEPSAFTELCPFNCSSKYLRFTTAGIPNSRSLASRWHLPLGAVVCPLAEASEGEEVPIVNFGSAGVVRCRRCRTYVNPYVTFTDGGRKWRCNLCALLNDVTGDYFAQLDATGRRVDADQRPELNKGSVEFVAPTEYMVRPPMPPLYFFLIDVSVSAVKSGMLESTLTQPQMMVMSDVDDVFLPLPDDLLVNLSESRNVVESFLDSLPSMFQDTSNVESAFGPALKAASMVMGQLGGKLMIFQNSLPSIGIGRLRLRGEDVRVYGTDKEHSLRVAEDPFYKQMAADFTKYQIGVNVYAFSDKFTDVASLGSCDLFNQLHSHTPLGTLSKYTGGQVYFYPSFKSALQKDKLRHELARDLTRETAWEAVMRIRCGKGVRFSSYHGNFMLRSTDLLALPAVDCDKAFAMQLTLEETLLTTQTVYFQVALLYPSLLGLGNRTYGSRLMPYFSLTSYRYTASCGERRIRVHTAAAPVVADLGEMYRQADTGAVVSVLGRLAIEKTLTSKLDDSRTYLLKTIVKALREYRNLHAVQHRLAGRMIYPESLKYLPLYVLALCKSTALRGGHADVQLDERCAAGSTLMTLPVKSLLKFLYPSLFRVDEFLLKVSSSAIDFKDVEKSLPRLPLTAESLDPRGLYIFDDGFRFVIWIGRMLPPDFVSLCESENETSRRLMGLINKMRESNPAFYRLCHLVRQGEQPREGFYLLANLIEDQTGGTSGYADWIMQIHRQVQQNA
ncbi:hypothetical protein KSS87_018487 [Heliosperma pusillum]|nr:hypothetical protein KSS87_018487 [Heliosperma pusillum]